jgi:nitrate reductase NapE component
MMYMCIYDLVVGMEALYVLVVGLYELMLVCAFVAMFGTTIYMYV